MKNIFFFILLINNINIAVARIGEENSKLNNIETRLKEIEEFRKIYSDLNITGQMTIIRQSSNLSEHQSSSGTISGDLIFEKKINQGLLNMDIQFANGAGIDANLQGGAMVNNDVMEDPDHHNQVYLAKLYYHHQVNIVQDYNLNMDIGKVGVNDYFDPGIQVSDQTIQFLNQAVNNNGAFDYVQDLSGHGYTYGLHLALENDTFGIDAGLFSSDSYLDNIDKKYSSVIGLKWTPEWSLGTRSFYQIYTFTNFGEYGSFNSDGNFKTQNAANINLDTNLDDKNKRGYGININHSLSNGIDLFAKYGSQDDDRDIRHYQDMDRSTLIGAAFNGHFWGRELDSLGLAFEKGQLTGNHKKAHEKGYKSFFDRTNGIGTNNYQDENVIEIYYRYAINEYSNISLDYQKIENFNYNKNAKTAQFIATRFNVIF